MQITIRNNTELPKKVIRFIQWKLYEASRKFQHLIYAEVHLNAEGSRPCKYYVHIRLGIPGNDIIIRQKSTDLGKIFKKISGNIHRSLAKSSQTINS